MAPSCLLNFCVKLKYNYIMFPLPFLPPTTPTHTHALSQILSPVLKIPHLPVFFFNCRVRVPRRFSPSILVRLLVVVLFRYCFSNHVQHFLYHLLQGWWLMDWSICQHSVLRGITSKAFGLFVAGFLPLLSLPSPFPFS